MTQTRDSVIPKVVTDTGYSPDRSALNGCPWHDVKAMLREVGLRPTRQRMALGWILFGKGDRHITAEMLYEEATRASFASDNARFEELIADWPEDIRAHLLRVLEDSLASAELDD